MRSRLSRLCLEGKKLEVQPTYDSYTKLDAYPVGVVEEAVDLAYKEGYNTALEDLMSLSIEALRRNARGLKY